MTRVTKKQAPLNERDIEKYLHKRVHEAGGEYRRLRWIGRSGAPDDAIVLNGVHLVECKAPSKKLSPHQAREHKRLNEQGVPTYVLDSYAMVDTFLSHISAHVLWEYT